MAKMTVCKVCKAQMATSAKACPSCGARKKKPLLLRLLLLILFVVVIIAIATSGSNSNKQATTTTGNAAVAGTVATVAPFESIKVNAAELIKAYSDNEVRADATYKNKILTVTGKVSDISVVLGQTSVTIGTGEVFEWGINCYFGNNQQDKISALNKDDTITVTGKCDGKSILTVTLRNCTIEP